MRLFDASNCKQIVKNRGTPNFTQLNLNQKHPENIRNLSKITQRVLNLYKKDFKEYTRWYPDRLFLEEFRMKKLPFKESRQI